MQAKPVTQRVVEQSEVQRAMLSLAAGDPPPQWMNIQVTAHSHQLHACCFSRLVSRATWTQALVCDVGQQGGNAFGGHDDTWLRSAAF